MSDDQVQAAGGWCAPTVYVLPEGTWDMPTVSVTRGGISDFTSLAVAQAVRDMPAAAECGGNHRWERSNAACQCCGRPDQGWLECATCSVTSHPGDVGFDEAWESAPWWWDE